MNDPFHSLHTEVQQVWEILLDDGTVYTHNEEPTAAAALAKAEADRDKWIAYLSQDEAEHGELKKGAAYYRSLSYTTVRRRTSVSVHAHTTEYGEEIPAEALREQ